MSLKARARGLLKSGLRHAVATVGRWGEPDEAPRILCYHGVCDEPPDEWSVTPRQLREQLAIICDERKPVSLPQMMSWFLHGTPLPSRAVAITFDDGYQDVLRHAAPILATHGVVGTAFVITGLLDGQDHSASYLPTRPLLTWAEVRELLAAGWTIGSHCLTHPVLANQATADAARELTDSRRRLSDVLGIDASLLAYPYGTRQTVSLRDRELAQEAGYQAAFLDAIGSLSRGQDRFALPRCKVLGSDSWRVFRASVIGQLDLWRRVEDR